MLALTSPSGLSLRGKESRCEAALLYMYIPPSPTHIWCRTPRASLPGLAPRLLAGFIKHASHPVQVGRLVAPLRAVRTRCSAGSSIRRHEFLRHLAPRRLLAAA
jgi:hypothetical protein